MIQVNPIAKGTVNRSLQDQVVVTELIMKMERATQMQPLPGSTINRGVESDQISIASIKFIHLLTLMPISSISNIKQENPFRSSVIK